MPAEAQIEKRVVAWCKDHGIYTRKFSSPAHRGVPDRIFIHNGNVVFLEFKAPGKKPTALQKREMKLLSHHGIAAMSADNYEVAVNVLSQLFLIA